MPKAIRYREIDLILVKSRSSSWFTMRVYTELDRRLKLGEWSYMAMLGFVLVATWWLEFAFRLRVLRNPKRLLTTLALVSPWFVLWDAYAISLGHWFFDRSQMTGIIGPFSIPLEEYLFFILIPIAAVLTLEGVTNFLPTVRGWLLSVRKPAVK